MSFEGYFYRSVQLFTKNRRVVVSYLNSRSGWVSISQQLVSCGLDIIHLLLPELQLSHQTLPPKTNNWDPVLSQSHYITEPRSSSTE